MNSFVHFLLLRLSTYIIVELINKISIFSVKISRYICLSSFDLSKTVYPPWQFHSASIRNRHRVEEALACTRLFHRNFPPVEISLQSRRSDFLTSPLSHRLTVRSSGYRSLEHPLWATISCVPRLFHLSTPPVCISLDNSLNTFHWYKNRFHLFFKRFV